MPELLSPEEILSRLKLAVLAEKGLPADATVPPDVLAAFRVRSEVAAQLIALHDDLGAAVCKVLALAAEGMGRVDARAEPPQPVTTTWLALGERLLFVLGRALDLFDDAWRDPLGVDDQLTPAWDLGSCTVSRVLGSEPGPVGTRRAYVEAALLQYLRIQARVLIELGRSSLHEVLAAYARLVGGPVPVEGESAAGRVRHLRVRRPLGEPLAPSHLGVLAEAWLSTLSRDVEARPESTRAARKRERWLADDAARFRAHLAARHGAHLRRFKAEARRLLSRAARAARRFQGVDARARRLPPAH